MICFFVESDERALQLAGHLDAPHGSVDGPFRTQRGTWNGLPARVYTVEQGGDAAYGAARIALRRGATRLIAITESTVVDSAAEELPIMPGQLVRVGKSYDLGGLAPLLRVLPDSARDLPLPLRELLPQRAIFDASRGEDLPAVGTPPWRIDNPNLARALYETRGIALLDRQMSGYAAAAVETEVSFFPLSLICSVSTGDGKIHSVPLQLADDFERFLAALMKG
ncbi:hypothetical protein IT570_07370 [Candidatus Sumerlaeota bacterium]|nr:hypothetical protein [Candidatus Sumerlaeota bacterium]